MRPRTALVVGAGAGGMTLALLLARAGLHVTLTDCQPEIGGYLRRFTRDGLRFDTGYHFSGGFTGVMAQIMRVLGLDDMVSAQAIPNRIHLAENGADLTLPAACGLEGARAILCDRFPRDAAALSRLFDAVGDIWQQTPMRDLSDLSPQEITLSQYDAVTVGEFCNTLGLSPEAATAAGSFTMCHGTPPAEAPMSFHARVGYALCDDLARPVGGGDPMIAAFRREAAKFGIGIRTGVKLLRFDAPDAHGECRLARFDDGTAQEADLIFFTIHPLAVRGLLPETAMTPSFSRRIRRLRETTAFFCSYFRADADADVTPGLISYFSRNDLDAILNGNGTPYSTGYMIEKENGATVVAAFRTMPPGTPDASADRRERRNDARYQEFKARTTEEIAEDLLRIMPGLRGRLHPVVSGTPLTCLDYDPPTGSAYGVCCVCGQSRIFGRLPVRNFHAAGQSALVPGVMGTMLASFTVFRTALGDETYCRVLRESGLV